MTVILGLSLWYKSNKISGRRVGYRHLLACTPKELRDFAERVGIPKCWYHSRPVPHYDLNPHWSDQALLAGAVNASLHLEGQYLAELKAQQRERYADRRPQPDHRSL